MNGLAGTTVVRLSLWMFVSAGLAMALVQPVTAGTEAAPEIADPANDQAVVGTIPISTQPPGGVTSVGLNADLLFGWIDGDTATSITLNLRIQGTGAPTTSSATQYTFHLEVAGTGYDAGAKVAIANVQGGLPGSGAVTPTGVTESATVEGGLVKMVVPKANIGSPAGGAVLTNLFATAAGRTADLEDTVTDRAPNAGAGADYTVTGGGGGGSCPNCTADDTDGDGLNDTWETQYFGNTTAQNATGDPDGDGLTNGQEQALGTDPTKADTDGDGVNDKEDPFPTDPTKGGTTTSSSSTSTSPSSSSSSSSRSSSSASTSDDKCADGDSSDAVDCLQSDVGYLGMSAGGFLAVVVLCVVALATRWSL